MKYLSLLSDDALYVNEAMDAFFFITTFCRVMSPSEADALVVFVWKSFLCLNSSLFNRFVVVVLKILINLDYRDSLVLYY